MSSPFIIAAIRDVAPTLSEPYPQELTRLVDTLYDYSKFKITLNQNEEIARYHICAIMAINRLQTKFNFLDPVLDKGPVPTKTAAQLLRMFEQHFQVKSAKSTPVSTPRKKRTIEHQTPEAASLSPPKRGRGRPSGSTKKESLTEKLEKANKQASPSPSLPPPSPSPTAEHSPFTSPAKSKISNGQRTPKSSPKKLQGSPSKGSPLKNTPSRNGSISAYNSPTKSMKQLTAADITALCNNFQLEAEVTENIMETFKQYYRKVANEWILLTGLVINCYFVINNRVISEQIGSKSNVIKTMFSLQNGGLMLEEVNTSVRIVQNLISSNKWFKQLKIKHGIQLEEKSVASTTGNMISSSVQFNSPQRQARQKEWIDNIRYKILSRPYKNAQQSQI